MTPNIGILYIVGNHFSPWLIIRHRYLKIMLHLARINNQFRQFVRNCVSSIRAFSLRIEVTITMRRMSWIRWNQVWSPKLTGGHRSSPEPWPPLHALQRELMPASPWLASCSPPFHLVLSMAGWPVQLNDDEEQLIVCGCVEVRRERRREF